jgi:chorismate mutase / prephenate dehydratase
MSLQKYREAIDRLDKKIVELLNERTAHVLEIGALKIKTGEEIYAPHRELAVLERVCKLNPGPITNESLRAIYREIMSSALSLEKRMTVAYFGPEATFTHQAAIRKFGSSLKYSAHKTIADVFTEVSKGRADYGVVPIENSTEGVVTHTLDMFVDSELKIVAQIILPIQQCLISNAKLEDIRKVYSHPQPIAQCREFLQTRLHHVEVVETSSTTRAAELAAREPHAAAIASTLAAERYGLNILEKDIQDSSSNATRFFVLGRQCSPPTGQDRSSLMLSIAHKVGALHKALSVFSKYKLNMSRIESRPNKRKAWEYFFFVDCDRHFQDKKLSKALLELERVCNLVKVLGSYPNAE